MADQNILGNIADNLKDQLEDNIDPGKLLSERNLKKKRGALWTCFIAGFLLILLSLGLALAINVTRVDLLKKGIDTYAVAKGIVSQSDADAFVNDTLDYLTGIKTVWEPAVTVGGYRIGVPDAFKAHMATVKGWMESAKAILLAGAAIVLLLLGRAMIGVKGSAKSPFSAGGYYLGAAVPLVVLVGVGLWGVFNFDSLWAWLHTTLIPDGIFPVGEEIMKLFTVDVFSGYLPPVATTFALCAGITLLLPLLLWPLSKLLTAMFGARGGAAAGTRRRAATKKTATAGRTSAKKTATKQTTRRRAD